jgi:hypothetical protein
MGSLRDFYIKENGSVQQPDGSYLSTTNGARRWFNEEGYYHREDGPALLFADGRRFWRINGIAMSFNQWLRALNISDEEKMLLRLRYE